MKTFSISGGSDDLIETDGIPGCDEFNVVKDGPHMAKLTIETPDSVTLDIHCIFDGYWAFAIGSQDGDCDEMPPWPIRRVWGKDAPYSEHVEIDVPDDAELTGDLVDVCRKERDDSDFDEEDGE